LDRGECAISSNHVVKEIHSFQVSPATVMGPA
jgi:hypothetical protein